MWGLPRAPFLRFAAAIIAFAKNDNGSDFRHSAIASNTKVPRHAAAVITSAPGKQSTHAHRGNARGTFIVCTAACSLLQQQ